MAPLLEPPPLPIPDREPLKGAAGEFGEAAADGLEDAVVDANMVFDAGNIDNTLLVKLTYKSNFEIWEKKRTLKE